MRIIHHTLMLRLLDIRPIEAHIGPGTLNSRGCVCEKSFGQRL